MHNPLIIPSAEPFFFPGGRTGCLLVHGFTGTPKEMRWLGEYLANRGHSVLGIRLAGHATHPEDMMRTRWRDWLASIEDGLCLLSSGAERVYAIGLSMGGILSLVAAARYPLAGVVAMATPSSLPGDWRMAFLRPLSLLQPEVSKGPPDWRDLKAAEDHISYPKYPTRSIAELKDLMAEMRISLPKIQIPALLIYSRHDETAPAESMEYISRHLSSADLSKLLVENSGHVLTREPDRQTVFEAVADFIDRVNAAQ